jgi:hypothetical protein
VGLGRQIELERVEQDLLFRRGLRIAGMTSHRPSVVGKHTSNIWIAAGFSSTALGVSPDAPQQLVARRTTSPHRAQLPHQPR